LWYFFVDKYTLWGYIKIIERIPPRGIRWNMERKNHIDDNIIKRLSRIEGQIRGIKEMGTNGASCNDILTQLSAVSSAVKQVSKLVMLDHLEHCVVEGIQDGDIDQTLKDMSDVIDRYSKMK